MIIDPLTRPMESLGNESTQDTTVNPSIANVSYARPYLVSLNSSIAQGKLTMLSSGGPTGGSATNLGNLSPAAGGDDDPSDQALLNDPGDGSPITAAGPRRNLALTPAQQSAAGIRQNAVVTSAQGSTLHDLTGLSPAAGGNTPDDVLGNLSPAAGGSIAAGGPSGVVCANAFLDHKWLDDPRLRQCTERGQVASSIPDLSPAAGVPAFQELSPAAGGKTACVKYAAIAPRHHHKRYKSATAAPVHHHAAHHHKAAAVTPTCVEYGTVPDTAPTVHAPAAQPKQ